MIALEDYDDDEAYDFSREASGGALSCELGARVPPETDGRLRRFVTLYVALRAGRWTWRQMRRGRV